MNATQLVQDVLDGEMSGLVALAILREEAKMIKDCIDKIEPTATDEAEAYTEKTFQFKGYEFTKKNGGAMYSFKHIPEWNNIKDQLKDFEDQCKAALKAKEKNLLTATADGEEVILPEVTYRKDSISIKAVD